MAVRVTESCVGCGICASICIGGSLSIVDGRAVYDPAECVECGQCFGVCPVGAIQMFGQSASDYGEIGRRDDTETIIKMRRSMRNFTSEKIPDEEISEMLDYTKYCPSAKN